MRRKRGSTQDAGCPVLVGDRWLVAGATRRPATEPIGSDGVTRDTIGAIAVRRASEGRRKSLRHKGNDPRWRVGLVGAVPALSVVAGELSPAGRLDLTRPDTMHRAIGTSRVAAVPGFISTSVRDRCPRDLTSPAVRSLAPDHWTDAPPTSRVNLAKKRSHSIGLLMKSSQPSLRHSSRSSLIAYAVTATIGAVKPPARS